MIEVIILS